MEQSRMKRLRTYLEKRGHDFSRSPIRCGSCGSMILVLAQWKDEDCRPKVPVKG